MKLSLWGSQSSSTDRRRLAEYDHDIDDAGSGGKTFETFWDRFLGKLLEIFPYNTSTKAKSAPLVCLHLEIGESAIALL
jgi:hypothetical protein